MSHFADVRPPYGPSAGRSGPYDGVVADDLTLWHVLEAFASREARRGTPYSTKTEIATELDRSRLETDPLIDEAISAGHLEENSRYDGYWRLTRSADGFLDAPAFMPSE